MTLDDIVDLVGSFEPVVSPLGGLYTGAEVDVTFTITNVDADANDLGSANGAWVDRFCLDLDGHDGDAVERPRFSQRLHRGYPRRHPYQCFR